MSKSNFADTIIGKLRESIGTDGQGYSTECASTAMQAVADGITEYLTANTRVTVSYNGIIPGAPPQTDPVKADTFKIVGSCAPTGPSDNFDAWIRLIEGNIIAGFTLAPKGEKGVSFPAAPFLIPGIATVRDSLYSIHNANENDPQHLVWEAICQGIIDWIEGVAANTNPGPASRASAPSTGTAIITGIKIQ